ncbi:MAG: hypothetical protein D6805_09990 [Planctomycetota bacterium]|nr:MAG: hypothetical protein D6805_09990 [Planctomycetota bacterium]
MFSFHQRCRVIYELHLYLKDGTPFPIQEVEIGLLWQNPDSPSPLQEVLLYFETNPEQMKQIFQARLFHLTQEDYDRFSQVEFHSLAPIEVELALNKDLLHQHFQGEVEDVFDAAAILLDGTAEEPKEDILYQEESYLLRQAFQELEPGKEEIQTGFQTSWLNPSSSSKSS